MQQIRRRNLMSVMFGIRSFYLALAGLAIIVASSQGGVKRNPGLFHFTPLGFCNMMNKVIQVFVIVGLILSLSPVASSQTKKKSPAKQSLSQVTPMGDEDYAVYAALLNELYGGKALALEREVSGCTSIGSNKEGENSWQKSLDGLPQKLVKLSAKTIADFKSRSRLCRTLDATFNASVTLLSKQERRAIFASKDTRKDWAGFYKKFPGSSGYIIVSSIGFNEDRSQALVDLTNKCGDKCGAEQFVLLTKVNGGWRVSAKHKLWEL